MMEDRSKRHLDRLRYFPGRTQAPLGRPIRLMAVDDEPAGIRAIGMQLDGCSGVEFAGVALTASQAVEEIVKKNPDIVLLDVRLDQGLGFDVIRRLGNPPLPRFVCLTSFLDPEFVQQALDCRCWGFLIKNEDLPVLSHALFAVVHGWRVFSKEAANVAHLLRPEEFATEIKLTERQASVFLSHSKGQTDREIATSLGVSRGAVRSALLAAQKKLGICRVHVGHYVKAPR